MIIHAQTKDVKRFKQIKCPHDDVQFIIEDTIDIPVIMHKTADDALVEYLRGRTEICNFLKSGWNRIIKKCPYRHRKCIGEKCSLYFIENGTGDCVLIWHMFKKNGET